MAGFPAAEDLLTAARLDELAAETIFAGHIHCLASTGSTNADANAAAAAGAAEGTVFFADEQRAGRGRGGHTWESVAGANLYVSAILRPPLEPNDTLVLAMMTGLAMRAAVREVTTLACDLRWPNDLLLGGRKCCGILAEMSTAGSQLAWVVAGAGLNVNQLAFAAELAPVATSLRCETGRSWPRVELAAACLRTLDAEYRRVKEAPAAARAAIFERFTAASSFVRGARVRVEEQGGYEGVTAGLDERGFLLVETGEGLCRVLHGGVRKI